MIVILKSFLQSKRAFFQIVNADIATFRRELMAFIEEIVNERGYFLSFLRWNQRIMIGSKCQWQDVRHTSSVKRRNAGQVFRWAEAYR